MDGVTVLAAARKCKPSGVGKHDEIRRRYSRKIDGFSFDALRFRELNKLARHRHPDGSDYMLPEAPSVRHLAVAIITHQRPNNKLRWLIWFCRERAPWLDPNEINIAQLYPDKAEPLGKKLQLTAAERTSLRITTIAPCDQTPAEREAARKERKRQRDRDRRRRQRAAAGGIPRAQYEATSKSQKRPWEAEGMSKRTWYRRMAQVRRPANTPIGRRRTRATVKRRGRARLGEC